MLKIQEDALVNNGFTLIGHKGNGLKVYIKDNALDGDAIVMHLVTEEGESLGVQMFEKEIVKLLAESIE